MNKAELIDAVASKTGASKTTTAEALDALMATIKETLTKQDSVQLVGFGTFAVTERAAREGRNPTNGNTINIPAKKVVKFKVGKALSDAVAGVETAKVEKPVKAAKAEKPDTKDKKVKKDKHGKHGKKK